MKEHNIIPSLQETEELCRLYNDCRLSVAEETELEYVLGKLPYSSELIDETRELMGLTRRMQFGTESKKPGLKFRIIRFVSGVAASIIAVVGIMTMMTDVSVQPEYIAYVDGTMLTGKDAEELCVCSMKQSEEFMRMMDEMQTQEEAKINNIIQQNSSLK